MTDSAIFHSSRRCHIPSTYKNGLVLPLFTVTGYLIPFCNTHSHTYCEKCIKRGGNSQKNCQRKSGEFHYNSPQDVGIIRDKFAVGDSFKLWQKHLSLIPVEKASLLKYSYNLCAAAGLPTYRNSNNFLTHEQFCLHSSQTARESSSVQTGRDNCGQHLPEISDETRVPHTSSVRLEVTWMDSELTGTSKLLYGKPQFGNSLSCNTKYSDYQTSVKLPFGGTWQMQRSKYHKVMNGWCDAKSIQYDDLRDNTELTCLKMEILPIDMYKTGARIEKNTIVHHHGYREKYTKDTFKSVKLRRMTMDLNGLQVLLSMAFRIIGGIDKAASCFMEPNSACVFCCSYLCEYVAKYLEANIKKVFYNDIEYSHLIFQVVRELPLTALIVLIDNLHFDVEQEILYSHNSSGKTRLSYLFMVDYIVHLIQECFRNMKPCQVTYLHSCETLSCNGRRNCDDMITSCNENFQQIQPLRNNEMTLQYQREPVLCGDVKFGEQKSLQVDQVLDLGCLKGIKCVILQDVKKETKICATPEENNEISSKKCTKTTLHESNQRSAVNPVTITVNLHDRIWKPYSRSLSIKDENSFISIPHNLTHLEQQLRRSFYAIDVIPERFVEVSNCATVLSTLKMIIPLQERSRVLKDVQCTGTSEHTIVHKRLSKLRGKCHKQIGLGSIMGNSSPRATSTPVANRTDNVLNCPLATELVTSLHDKNVGGSVQARPPGIGNVKRSYDNISDGTFDCHLKVEGTTFPCNMIRDRVKYCHLLLNNGTLSCDNDVSDNIQYQCVEIEKEILYKVKDSKTSFCQSIKTVNATFNHPGNCKEVKSKQNTVMCQVICILH